MDGYAVLDGDVRDAYKVLETVMAGSTPTAPLQAGAAVKVMTGAPVPSGAGRVIPVEHVRRQDDAIEIIRPTNDRNICPQGEDVRPGDMILRAGSRLGPLEIANLISCGITEVDVFRPIRLAVLSTGDEIVDDPRDLGPGKIMNANGPMLALLGRRYSMEIVMEKSIPDRRDATVEAISSACECTDLVLLSGGVSVGDYDFVGAALADAGLCVHFSAVAVKPGRPLTFATRPGAAVFGLPGNPVSVYVMFHLFVLRGRADVRQPLDDAGDHASPGTRIPPPQVRSRGICPLPHRRRRRVDSRRVSRFGAPRPRLAKPTVCSSFPWEFRRFRPVSPFVFFP